MIRETEVSVTWGSDVWRVARYSAAGALGAALMLGGCRPSDVLSVPVPVGVVPGSALKSQTGAESAFNTARFQAFSALVGVPSIAGLAGGGGGVLEWSSLLTDEFRWATWAYDYPQGNIDARITTGTFLSYDEPGDEAVQSLLNAERSLLLAIPGLRQYEPASGRSKMGEAFAVAGYTELVMAEDYCAGVPLGRVPDGGGFQYGVPLTTDSLLGAAEADLDSALANANGDPAVQNLASIGLGRTRLDRGRFAQAAAAVANVPTSFVYNTQLPPSYGDGGVKAASVYGYLYHYQSYVTTYNSGSPYNLTFFTMSDREGGDGLNFVSAQDPRVVVDSSLGTTPDGTVWYFPKKFEANLSYVPLATGVEARLIEAEAALAQGSPGNWATALNALRADTGETQISGLQPLPLDSTTLASPAQQLDVMFRERAFWLYGTGTRLGDLRRLVRQYGRDQSTVFPSGPYVPTAAPPSYAAPAPATYGTDVALTLPTAASAGFGYTTGNPNYKGCLNKNA